MKYRLLLDKMLLHMSLAATLWLLVGLVGVYSDTQTDQQKFVLLEQGADTESNNQEEQITATHLMHAVACMPHDNTSHIADHLVRMSLRQTRSARRFIAHWLPCIRPQSTIWCKCKYWESTLFTLASSGVTYISPRACNYYIFALRHILD